MTISNMTCGTYRIHTAQGSKFAASFWKAFPDSFLSHAHRTNLLIILEQRCEQLQIPDQLELFSKKCASQADSAHDGMFHSQFAPYSSK